MLAVEQKQKEESEPALGQWYQKQEAVAGFGACFEDDMDRFLIYPMATGKEN